MPTDDGEAEIPLYGGRANAGSVMRIGDEVARPAHPQTPFVDHFLNHLQSRGVTLGPTPLGLDDQGRQRLSFIPGQAPTSPYPDWAFDEGLLVDLASQQQSLHAAGADYEPPADAIWAVSGGNYFPAGSDGTSFCHNDLCMSNVIVDVDTCRVAGFVDFDYVAPVNPLFDIAVLARHWAPFGDLSTVSDLDVDRVRRFRLICDVHDLDGPQRRQVVDLGISFLEQARTNVRALADGGNPGFQQMIAAGYEATNQATVDWLIEHQASLAIR